MMHSQLLLKMFVSSRDTFDKTLVFAVYDYDRYISSYIPCKIKAE